MEEPRSELEEKSEIQIRSEVIIAKVVDVVRDEFRYLLIQTTKDLHLGDEQKTQLSQIIESICSKINFLISKNQAPLEKPKSLINRKVKVLPASIIFDFNIPRKEEFDKLCDLLQGHNLVDVLEDKLFTSLKKFSNEVELKEKKSNESNIAFLCRKNIVHLFWKISDIKIEHPHYIERLNATGIHGTMQSSEANWYYIIKLTYSPNLKKPSPIPTKTSTNAKRHKFSSRKRSYPDYSADSNLPEF